VNGESVKQIGQALGISVNTVKRHLSSLYLKLDAPCRVVAVRKLIHLQAIKGGQQSLPL
jgi:DNA-binding NarL/FixJ family response regulator